MNRRTSIAVTALTLILSWEGSARAADRSRRCGLDRATIVKQSGGTEVLRTPKKQIYSCYASTGKRKLLARIFSDLSGNGESISRIAIAGRLIAYARYVDIDGSYTAYLVDVVDARRGRRTTGDAGPIEAVGGDEIAPISKLKVTSTGQVAWVFKNPNTEPVRYEVHQRSGRRDQLLAASQTIDRDLLIVSDGLVIWRQDGALQSAPIIR